MKFTKKGFESEVSVPDVLWKSLLSNICIKTLINLFELEKPGDTILEVKFQLVGTVMDKRLPPNVKTESFLLFNLKKNSKWFTKKKLISLIVLNDLLNNYFNK